MNRAFPFAQIERDGMRHNALRIDCRCGVQAFFKAARGGHKDSAASAHAESHFRSIGWTIGNRPKDDRCPDCSRRSKPDLKVISMEPKPEAPREMSREDRRIIFAKVDELYLDDKSGYTPPWTDAAVARDLGVPRAWVAGVRDELFGPEGSNAEFDDFLARAEPLIAEMRNLNRSAAAKLEEARRLSARIDELERVAKRVEREIGKT